MVNLHLIRQESIQNHTFGVLFYNKRFLCFTLENTEKIIPTGSYKITFYDSPKFQRKVPLLMDVPGRSFIEIHIANYAHELDGCIAVGKHMNTQQLFESRVTFDLLMSKLGKNPNSTKYIHIDTL